MSDDKSTERAGFGSLFERVTVMHATDRWAGVAGDVEAVPCEPERGRDARAAAEVQDGRAGFEAARTVKPGKPTFRLALVSEE